MKSSIYYQRIFKRDGRLWGIELLTRGEAINPSPYSDLLFFQNCIEVLKEKRDFLEEFKENGWKVHLNLYPHNARNVLLILNDTPQLLRDVLVIEIIEKDIDKYVDDVVALKNNLPDGTLMALDDFGRASSNFEFVPLFKIVKIDGIVIRNPDLIAKTLKEDYRISVVILEKTCDKKPKESYRYVDCFQNFELHKPCQIS